jgi:predicted ATP-dependent endonuclease of OLD family
MITQLKKFRVTKFRSVKDSGWIDVNNTTCLVGTNESGKTNLLLALWKLNPANDEEIDPLSDYPRKEYVDFAKTNGNEVFISAEFEVNQSLAENLSSQTGFHTEITKNVKVSRNYNGEYSYEFGKTNIDNIGAIELKSFLSKMIEDYKKSDVFGKEEDSTNKSIADFIENQKNEILDSEKLEKVNFQSIRQKFEDFLIERYKRKTNINAFFDNNFYPYIDKSIRAFDDGGIQFPNSLKDEIFRSLPKFVYYSDYVNIDSEIYLPHVIENFKRDNLGQKEKAKSRSLKVLFEFVNLSPNQILELGKEALPRKVITKNYQGGIESTKMEEAEEEDIQEVSLKKKEREILLQSASTKMTAEFKDWWKQGNYKFRFQADGNHFRIWVSDEKRQEEIELEGRSKGLQWFFSFFLIFLVESKDTHSNCVLLLDEPGISLHPMAQIDLIRFFSSLSRENQIVYTTHSPFLVNPDNLGNVYAMYVGDGGESIVSPDLRANNKVDRKSVV